VPSSSASSSSTIRHLFERREQVEGADCLSVLEGEEECCSLLVGVTVVAAVAKGRAHADRVARKQRGGMEERRRELKKKKRGERQGCDPLQKHRFQVILKAFSKINHFIACDGYKGNNKRVVWKIHAPLLITATTSYFNLSQHHIMSYAMKALFHVTQDVVYLDADVQALELECLVRNLRRDSRSWRDIAFGQALRNSYPSYPYLMFDLWMIMIEGHRMQRLKDVLKARIEKEQQSLRSQAILRMTMLVAFMVFVALYNGVKGFVGLFVLALLILASGSSNGTLGSQFLTMSLKWLLL